MWKAKTETIKTKTLDDYEDYCAMEGNYIVNGFLISDKNRESDDGMVTCCNGDCNQGRDCPLTAKKQQQQKNRKWNFVGVAWVGIILTFAYMVLDFVGIIH